jgi:DNA-binding CsgD family transcriptional regulator
MSEVREIAANFNLDLLFSEFARACSECYEESTFAEIIRTIVRRLLPHSSLVAALGRVDLDHLEILKLIGVDYPVSAIEALRRTSNVRERQALLHWLRSRQPLLLELPQDAKMMSELERGEIERNRLGRIGAHGVLDIFAREGSYFSFAGIPDSILRDESKSKLRLVVPHLHQALLAIYRAECSVLHYGVALTAVEQDLLRWIAAGRTNEEIAALRGRSPSTVRNQLSSMFKKLGAGNRAEAVRLAHGVLHNVR